MTLPFASFLLLLFTSFPDVLPRLISDFLVPFIVPEKVFVETGFLILVCSVIYLMVRKKCVGYFT